MHRDMVEQGVWDMFEEVASAQCGSEMLELVARGRDFKIYFSW